MSELEFKQYDRRPFTVNAIQVALDNIEELAKVCGGRVDQAPTKMMGTETMLPCIKLPGQGAHKNQEFTANIGSWIVEYKGMYRVYKPVQFRTTFAASPVAEKDFRTEPQVEEYIDSSSHMVELPAESDTQSVL